jgi:peptidoglycan-associated lipoprotein
MHNPSNASASSTTRSRHPLVSGFFAVLLAVSLVACGSNVKLDEAPVEDRNAAGAAGTQGGAGSGVDPRGVSGVQVPGID